MALMALAVFVVVEAVGTSPVFGIKLEEGYFPPGSERVVASGRIGVIVATAMIVVSSGLAASAVAVRPHPFVQVMGVLTLLGVLPVLLLLLFGYGLAF